MGAFEIGGLTLKWLFKHPSTTQYPKEEKPVPAGRRGHVVNDIGTCILCSSCVKGCPASALVVDRKAGTWTINNFKCVQCAHCVRVCPTHSLTMSTGILGPQENITTTTMTKPHDSAKSPKEAAGAKATPKPEGR